MSNKCMHYTFPCFPRAVSSFTCDDENCYTRCCIIAACQACYHTARDVTYITTYMSPAMWLPVLVLHAKVLGMETHSTTTQQSAKVVSRSQLPSFCLGTSKFTDCRRQTTKLSRCRHVQCSNNNDDSAKRKVVSSQAVIHLKRRIVQRQQRRCTWGGVEKRRRRRGVDTWSHAFHVATGRICSGVWWWMCDTWCNATAERWDSQQIITQREEGCLQS